MLYDDRIDVPEGIDVNKTKKPRQCNRFKFQPDVCNMCHNVLMMFMNLRDIVILKIYRVDNLRIIRIISTSEAIKLMQNINLTKKSRTFQNIKFY